MALYLSHADVKSVITMEDVLPAVEQAFADYGGGTAVNLPRQHLRAPVSIYRAMSGSMPGLGGMGTKVGLHSSEKTAGAQTDEHSHVLTVLYGTEAGTLQAVIWSDLITDFRTGAMAGISAKYLARPDASVLGFFGSGRQARTALRAVALVRTLQRVRVYSPTPEHRRAFADEMAAELDLEVEPVDSPQMAVAGADIVVGSANTLHPVFDDAWLEPGTHVASMGGSRQADANYPEPRREIDDRTVERSDVVTLDSMEQAIIQGSPELSGAIKQGRVVELGAIVSGRAPGRTNADQITLFKSFGMGLQDVAAAAVVYQRARAAGIGLELESPYMQRAENRR